MSNLTLSYYKETRNTLYVSGEYLVLANAEPYTHVKQIKSAVSTTIDTGIGTILKQEFRYSVDGLTFSEFQELTNEALQSLGSFDTIYFQFRYILLSGGPITISKIDVNYESSINQFENYTAPNIQDQSKVYAFPITYKSNFLWEPYKMNRAVRLYKDLNLMVNNMFGHDVTYYRSLPQGRSKDVFLMEYSLYGHAEGTCVKVVVPENAFPDNKLNMGLYGPDFESQFEIHIDKDYYQKIFGEGSGPQKRDVIHFHRTGRVYEISSSYLFRDFMNEPLYFKVILIKWNPKSDSEQSASLNTLEDFTVSAAGLFGELMENEETKITSSEQFEIAYRGNDEVRYKIADSQKIIEEELLNYYTIVSNHYYDMKTCISGNQFKINATSSVFELNKQYFVRVLPTSVQTDPQNFYSVRKIEYLGTNDGGLIFKEYSGNSQISSNYFLSDIFNTSSSYYIFENEYVSDTNSLEPDYILDCKYDCLSYYAKSVEYNAVNEFLPTQDRSFSCWFAIEENTNKKLVINSFSFDKYNKELTISIVKDVQFLIGDLISLTKDTNTFNLFGKVAKIIDHNTITVIVDNEIVDFVNANFNGWEQYTGISIQKSYPKVFLNSLNDSKGIKIELYENRHFKVTMNADSLYFSIPGSSLPVELSKWHALFINFSNSFKQLTVNVWKMQWDASTKLPATTDLKLIYNKMVTMKQIDRTSNIKFFIEPSFIKLTNIRLYNKVAETDKQSNILNQNVVKDGHLGIIIDNAIPQTQRPLMGYTR